jgi:branched-chain amino acid aminotransferase
LQLGEYNSDATTTMAARTGEANGAQAQPARGAAMYQTASTNPTYLWRSGQLVPWAEATVHISMVGWPAIGAVFEGIRAYWNDDKRELYVFRLNEHLRRFGTSMKMMRMTPTFTPGEIADALCGLLRANGHAEDAYCQPLAFTGGSIWGSRGGADSVPEIVVTTRPSSSGLLSGSVSTAGISSWTRISDNVLPPRIKALPNYANSRLASHEAQRNGYDQPIFLNTAGKVAEGSGSCLFMVRDGIAITPATTASILESITRDAVIRLLRDLDVPVLERDVERTELYIADEVFFCGTAMEVHPVVQVDGYQVGEGTPGPIVTRLEKLFHDVVRGIDDRYPEWRTKV